MRDIIGLFHEELDGIYGAGEVGAFVEMLFEAFLEWDKVRLLTSKDETVDQSDLLRFHWALEDLKKYRPIQHIVGYTYFCGCRIKVSPDVLIPRPETEEMVEWVVASGQWSVSSGQCPVVSGQWSVVRGQRSEVRGQRSVVSGQILDLCTGSGCIAIALKKAFPAAEVVGVDISSAALEIARENAKNNGVDVRFIQADILVPQFSILDSQFSIIISNPPYVRESERAQMQRNVLDYDPALALFVPDDDPLRFYKAIASIAKGHLAADGMIVVEINEALADETCEVMKVAGFTPEVHNDFRGKARWISAGGAGARRGE